MTAKDFNIKACVCCNESKPVNMFYRHKLTKDLLRTECKECSKNKTAAYCKTKTGLIRRIYSHQNQSSVKRGHSLPNYTKKELELWLNCCPQFDLIYRLWVCSGYEKDKAPSVDRLDDCLSYSLDNIQVVTWLENRSRFYDDVKNGINKKRLRPVNQLSKDGELVANFYSNAQASRDTGIGQGCIGACCKGARRSAGGFKWSYA